MNLKKKSAIKPLKFNRVNFSKKKKKKKNKYSKELILIIRMPCFQN